MPTVTRSAGGSRSPSPTSVLTKRSGDNGYGVGTRNGCARIVPVSSSTEPLMPPPPQSIVNVNATPHCDPRSPRPRPGPRIVCADVTSHASQHPKCQLPAVAGATDQPQQTP